MRSVLMFVVSLIVALVGVTYYYGIKTQHSYERFLAQLDSQSGVAVKSHTFHRGILTSRAETVLVLGGQGDGMEVVSEDLVVHGPLSLGNLVRGVWRVKPAQALIVNRVHVRGPGSSGMAAMLFQKLPPLMMDSEITLAGGFVGRFEMEPARHEIEGGGSAARIAFSGMHGRVSVSPDMARLSASFDLPSLEAKGEEGELRLKGFKLNFDQGSAEAGKPLSMLKVVLAAFAVSGAESPSVAVRDVRFEAESGEREGKLYHLQNFHIGAVEVDGVIWGPARYELAVRNVDARAWADLKAQLRAAETGGEAEGRQQRGDALKMTELIPRFLAASPEIEISGLEIRTKAGDVRGSLRLWFKPPAAAPGGEAAAMAPLGLLTAANLDMSLSSPAVHVENVMERAVLQKIRDLRTGSGAPAVSEEEAHVVAREQVTAQLERLVEQGIVKLENDIYSVHVTYSDGVLKINGKERPLPLGAM